MLRSMYRAVVCASLMIAGGAYLAAQTPPFPHLPPLERLPIPPGPPLTLGQAIDEALQNNPALIALRLQFDAARRRPAQWRFLAPPTLSAQIWQWPIDTVSPLKTNMYMFTIAQEIPGRGKRDLLAAVAQRDAALAENDIATSARQTVTDLKHAYTALMVARSNVDAFADAAALLRQAADVSDAKYTAGRATQQDVLKPAAELSKLYDGALTAHQQADLASAQLNALMGRPVDAGIGPLADPSAMVPLPSIDSLMSLAVEHQPELQSARLNIDRAKAELGVVKSEGKPDFMVQGGYMLMPQGTDAWTGQVGITWPSAPWSRGKVSARIAETTSQVTASEAKLRSTENFLRLAVQQAYVRATTAATRARLLQSTIVPQTRQTLDASRVGYEADRVDFLTVLENARALVDEQLDYIHAMADLADARADLERAVGIDLGATSPQGGRR